MDEPREPLHPLDYLAMAAIGIVCLAIAGAIVWLLITVAEAIYTSGNGPTICSAAVLASMAFVIVARRK